MPARSWATTATRSTRCAAPSRWAASARWLPSAAGRASRTRTGCRRRSRSGSSPSALSARSRFQGGGRGAGGLADVVQFLGKLQQGKLEFCTLRTLGESGHRSSSGRLRFGDCKSTRHRRRPLTPRSERPDCRKNTELAQPPSSLDTLKSNRLPPEIT